MPDFPVSTSISQRSNLPRNIVSVIGARPQFIKAAVVSDALARQGCSEYVVHTGQHYDHGMSGIFFEELGMREPDVNLEVGSGSHAFQTGEMLMRLESILSSQSPDWVVIYGDTNSTLSGALAAAKLGLPIAHVEAGMRSRRRDMPEEINRVVADHLSSLLFCATATSVENLRREGLTQGTRLVGDVMYDAALKFLGVAQKRSSILAALGLASGEYILLTAHRAETIDNDEKLCQLVGQIAKLEAAVIFPAHPRTHKRLVDLGLISSLPGRIRVVPPVGYLDMLVLEANASVVLTDSGGVQREAFFLSVPSIILRAETEWPELVASGASALAGPDFSNLPIRRLGRVDPRAAASLFGDGHAGRRIAAELAGENSPVEEGRTLEPVVDSRSAAAGQVPES